jgi:hypothetical protein
MPSLSSKVSSLRIRCAFLLTHNTSAGRNLELWGASKKADYKEFKARGKDLSVRTGGDLSGAKHTFDKTRKSGVSMFKSFNNARKIMIKNMDDSFKDSFGKGGKVSKSLLNFNKMTK